MRDIVSAVRSAVAIISFILTRWWVKVGSKTLPNAGGPSYGERIARFHEPPSGGVGREGRRPVYKGAVVLRTLTEVFAPGAPTLPEGLRTLVVSPTRFVEPGATVRASLSFRNLGGGAAKGIRIRFSLPDGLTYLVDSARIDNAPLDTIAGVGALVKSGGAEIGEVEPGAERKISLAYIVAPTMENGTTIEIQAAIASSDLPLVGSNIVRLVVRSKPELAGAETKLTLSGPREVLPGSELTVSARVHNAGQSSANDVVVALPVPIGTAFMEGSAQVDGSAVDDRKQRDPFGYQHPLVIARKLGPGATAAVQFRVKVDAPLQDGTKIEARGSVASRETGEFDFEPASLNVASRPSFDGDRTGLEVTHFGGATLGEDVVPGAAIAIKLRAANAGTGAARDVALSVTLPPGLAPVLSSLRRDGQPIAIDSADAIVLPVGLLDAGMTVVFDLIAIVTSPAPAGRTLPIEAKVRWAGGARTFDRVLTVSSVARFSAGRNRIVREAPSIVAPGDDVSFAITVVNDGTATAADTLLRVQVDDGLDDVEVLDGDDVQALRVDPIVLGSIDPHVARTLTVRGRVRLPLAHGTEIGVRAAVSATGAAPLDLREERVLVRSRARFTAATSKLRRASDEAVRPDRSVGVVISVRNEGNDVARDLAIALRAAPELRLESVDGATRDGGTLTFTEIPAGSTREATATFRLLPFVPRETQLTVDGVLAGPTIMPVALDTLTFASHAEPRLTDGAALVTTPRDAIDAGAEAGFTLVLRNAGDGAAERVLIRGSLPAHTAYVPSSTSVNGVPLQDRNGTSLLWSQDGLALSDVAPGAEIVVRWLCIVNTPLPSDTVITAKVDVSCDDQPVFAVESMPLTVRSAPAFAVPSVALPFSIAGAAAPMMGGVDTSAFELPMRRVVPLPSVTHQEAPSNGSAERHAEAAVAGEGAIDASTLHFALDLSEERIRAIVDYVDQTNFTGLISHLFVLRALFPETVFADTDAQAALEAEHVQLRDVFNKLFVKLRLPRFKIGPKEIETPEARASAIALFETLRDAPPSRVRPAEAPQVRLSGTLGRSDCERLATQIEAAPPGSAMPFYALAHVLGTALERDGQTFASLGAYRAELIATLESLAARPVATFLGALGGERSAELDQTLGAFMGDLRPYVDAAN
jgi:uncharacterized repeat protein (TIGR01451 family)